MTREEAIKILTGYMGGKIDPESTEFYHAIELVVDILESKPSLPFNLDEAAEEIASDIAPTYPDIGWDECFEKIKDGIKAGAEWMARQGITVTGDTDDEYVRILEDIEKAICKIAPDSTINVQIRK